MLKRTTALLLCLLPSAADMLPLTAELCVAVGQEPYISIEEAGLPLPPTPEQIRALPFREFRHQQNAMKETLLMRWALIREARYRADGKVDAQSAGHARMTEAPALLAEIYQSCADGNLTRAQEHEIASVLELLLHGYRTDELAVRLLVHEAELTPDDVRALATFLPLDDAFNLLPLRPPTHAEMLSDLRCMRREYARLAEIYAAVQDKESADAAAVAALPVVRCLLTTARTAYCLRLPEHNLSPAQATVLKDANAAYARLMEQRTRLQQQGVMAESVRLRALDILAE